MTKTSLALLLGASLVTPFAAYSSPVIDRPESITLVLEIEHVQKEKLSNDDRIKLAALTETLEDATSDQTRKIAERRLALFQARTERTRALLLFGRATYWLPGRRGKNTQIGTPS